VSYDPTVPRAVGADQSQIGALYERIGHEHLVRALERRGPLAVLELISDWADEVAEAQRADAAQAAEAERKAWWASLAIEEAEVEQADAEAATMAVGMVMTAPWGGRALPALPSRGRRARPLPALLDFGRQPAPRPPSFFEVSAHSMSGSAMNAWCARSNTVPPGRAGVDLRLGRQSGRGPAQGRLACMAEASTWSRWPILRMASI